MRKLFLLTLLFAACSIIQAQDVRFAVVADSRSLTVAGDEINEYAAVITGEGLTAAVFEEKWHNADSVRTLLRDLYRKNDKFEGAVFIGDIPIPMLRDAQHLSSAFKMDQVRYPWHRSSIPSDRFYEDFDLQFTFLKADTNGLYFYYNLDAESPQYLSPDIYTGRIRIPGDSDGSQLRAYLKKVIKAHQEPDVIDEVLFFAGHGYNSESMTARMDEKAALLQQFPQLNKQANGLEYIDYTFDEHIKNRLLPLMTAEMTDIALLHHHGSYDAELAGSEKAANGVQQNIESIKFYLRSKVRGAKDPEASKKNYMEWLGVPESWFEGANDKEQTAKDSAWFAEMDIMAADVEKYDIKARFIMFDACYNGSFHRDEYISGAYVFGPGRTVAAQANSVNSLQDKFPEEMIGLLSYGMRVGEWNRMVCFLESHIIGDPTFRFASTDPKLNAEKILATRKSNSKLLKLAEYPHPDVQSWALWALAQNNYPGVSELLTKKYFSSSFSVVRMECLKQLSLLRDDNFIRVTAAALDDSYELVRRFAAGYCQESGDPQLVPALIKAVTNPNPSKRVNYHATDALAYFDSTLLVNELNRQFEGIDTSNYFGTIYSNTLEMIGKEVATCNGTVKGVTASDVTDKDRVFDIRSLRNQTYHTGINTLCDYLLSAPGEKTEKELIEALGWFSYSYNREAIIKTCQQIIASSGYTDDVKKEALRTINRIK